MLDETARHEPVGDSIAWGRGGRSGASQIRVNEISDCNGYDLVVEHEDALKLFRTALGGAQADIALPAD